MAMCTTLFYGGVTLARTDESARCVAQFIPYRNQRSTNFTLRLLDTRHLVTYRGWHYPVVNDNSLSPNGMYVASAQTDSAAGTYSLMLRRVASHTPMWQNQSLPRLARDILVRWSPDSQRIAYQWRDNENRFSHLVGFASASGNNASQHRLNAFSVHVHGFSADGLTLAFSALEGSFLNLYFWDIHDTQPKLRYSLRARVNQFPLINGVWSPTQPAFLWAVTNVRQPSVVLLTKDAVLSEVNLPSTSDSYVHWSPQGDKSLIALLNEDLTQELLLLGADGSQQHLNTNGHTLKARLNKGGWSEDGVFLYLIQDGKQRGDYYAYAPDSGKGETLFADYTYEEPLDAGWRLIGQNQKSRTIANVFNAITHQTESFLLTASRTFQMWSLGKQSMVYIGKTDGSDAYQVQGFDFRRGVRVDYTVPFYDHTVPGALAPNAEAFVLRAKINQVFLMRAEGHLTLYTLGAAERLAFVAWSADSQYFGLGIESASSARRLIMFNIEGKSLGAFHMPNEIVSNPNFFTEFSTMWYLTPCDPFLSLPFEPFTARF